MSNNTAQIVWEAGKYRIVLVSRERYCIEQKDGEDAMGTQRWLQVGGLPYYEERDEPDNIVIPRSVLRSLLAIVCATKAVSS